MMIQRTFKHLQSDDMNSTTENSQTQIDVVNVYQMTQFLYLLVELNNDYILSQSKWNVACSV